MGDAASWESLAPDVVCAGATPAIVVAARLAAAPIRMLRRMPVGMRDMTVVPPS